MKMFDKVLVANRGEIAVRVMRALRECGIKSVAVYSEPDREALHVRMADEAYCVGPAASRESYLVAEKILEVARISGAQAIHPGYGFLSERASFSAACEAAGIVFIGPKPYAIEAMGDKTSARKIVEAAGVPLVPGTKEPIVDPQVALTYAESIGYPVLIKASAGGGGKGMRRVDSSEQFVPSWDAAKREALASFGNDDVYIEKYVVNPRHVEFQVLADSFGHTIHVFERECSAQRRHQKIIEETPCPVLLPETRRKMGEVAVKAAKAVDYVGAGTIEFLLDADQNFYFLEMNTRLQVEHPITELISGVDLVKWQLRIAAGQPLTLQQDDMVARGHAIECRIYAEDPEQNFLPSPGLITRLREPGGPGVRVDGGVYEGATVPMYYDPMIAKLAVWAEDREGAIARMRRALQEYEVGGITTNIAYHEELLTHPEFVSGHYTTEFIPKLMRDRETPAPSHAEDAELVAVLAAHLAEEALVGGASVGGAKAVKGEVDMWKVLARHEQHRTY
jgi:acetyl-CoA carboxylase, biotin carboxylase subunit